MTVSDAGGWTNGWSHEHHQWIGGAARTGSSGQTHDIVDPSNGQPLQAVSLADAADVDAAVAVARAAQPGWGSSSPGERSSTMHRLAVLLDQRAESLAQTESWQAGKPIRLAREFDVPGTVDNTAFFRSEERRVGKEC